MTSDQQKNEEHDFSEPVEAAVSAATQSGACELCGDTVPCAACDPKLSAVRSSAFFEKNEKREASGPRLGKPGSPIRIGCLDMRTIWGVPRHCKRIVDLPAGAKIRLRLREQSIAEVFVRTANGVQRYSIEDVGEFWKLGPIAGENRTLQSVSSAQSAVQTL